MSPRTRRACLLLALTVLSAGCSSAAGQASSPASAAPPLSLATSLDTATGTWAVAVMGGSAASHNNFWQLFVRPTGTSKWRLVTPPGVASNGGLVVAGPGAGPVVAGFRPSQDLSYSPLATTHDNGTAWTPAILDARPGRRARRPRRRPGRRPPAGAADKRQGRHLRSRRHGLDHPGQPALTGRHRSRDPVQAGQPHRGGVQPIRSSHAGSQLCPPRDRRHLRLRRRHLAPRRAHVASLLRPPGRYRPPAHHHRQRHHGATRGRHRASGTPADSHLRRQRRPLDPVASLAPGRRAAHIGVIRNRRHSRDHLDREPGATPSPPRPVRGGRCPHCHQAPSHSRKDPPPGGTPWPSTAPG